MYRKITCKQVQAILPFYVKGRVNPDITALIEEHLSTCKACRELYLNALSEEVLCAEAPVIEAEEPEDKFATKEYANFKKQLSAYLDSELEDNENIKIKKMTISNPLARKDLEDMYQFKRLLHSSFARTKENFKYDFSKSIIKNLDDANFYQTDYFVKLGIFLLFISALLSISFWVA